MKYSLEGQETTRLRFRLLRPDDFAGWVPLFRAEGVAEMLGMDPQLTAEQQCGLWFEKTFYRYANDLGVMHALVDKTTGELVGQSGLVLQEVDGIPELEVSYSILPSHWNRGYASEAARTCIRFAFANDFADSLIAILHAANAPSERVALRCGMVFEKLTMDKGDPVKIYRIHHPRLSGTAQSD